MIQQNFDLVSNVQEQLDSFVRIMGMKPVGNYAYGIEFSDGHDTGIYTFEYLRELGEVAGN